MVALAQVPCALLNLNELDYVTMASTTRMRQHLLSSEHFIPCRANFEWDSGFDFLLHLIL